MKSDSFRNNRKALAALLLCTGFIAGQPLTVRATGNEQSVQTVQQQIKVSGTVSDALGPVIGASVVEKGNASNGTITDVNGNFSLSVPSGAMLLISYIGYKEVIIAAKPSLKIVMEEDAKMIDEVVVTGYMAEKKASLTGSVAVVKMKEVADIPTGNVMSGLQGRVAGMNVTTDGKPGGGNTDTKLRGITTINNSSPLYVIDGVQTHDNVASIISSNDVESIQVLKDAASAAIYGAQAANGVIIITTKRAKEGDVKVSFDMSLTAQTFTGGIDMLDAYQWGDVYWQAYKNTFGTNPNSVVYGNGEKAQLQEYYFDQNGVKIKSGNTDWAKEIFGTALMQNYNLSLSKGFKDGNVALTLNYMNQDGLCRNTDYERFNSRLASNFRFVDGKVRVGESISVNHWLEHLNPAGIEELVIAQHPAIPVYDENGGYAGGYVDILGDKPNAIRLTDNEANNRHKSWRIFGNVYLEVEPIKNLVLKSQFGLNYTTGFNSTFVPKWSEADRKVDVNELTVRQDNSVQWVWSNTANYSIDLGKNNISAVIGTEAKKENGEHLQGYGRGLVIEDLDYRYLDTVTEGKSVSNNASTYAMVSYFGKVNYAFDDKYLISGTVRRDASSRFGKGNNSAIFPSVSAGWRVSREKFMECTQNWLSDLKLRASWGINGNDQIDNNATYNLYYTNMSNGSYNFNGDGTTVLPGVQKDRSGNNDLKWEETKQLNFGIDAAFFDNRLGLTLDYFQKKTTGMLIQKPYIGVIGEGGYKWYNAASMDNSGVEATFTWRDEIKDFKYDISFNLSYYKNEITELPDVIKYTWGGGNGVDKTIVGQPYGSWMSYKADGVFKTKQEVYEYLSKYDVQIGAPGVGRIRYKDLNGDNIINTADMDWQGSDQPRFIGGLNIGASYKGFDLSVFFNGMIRDAWNNSKFYTDLFQGWTGNHSVRLMDAMHAWNAYEQTGVYNCDIPALTVVDNNVETRSSTFFIEDGSYVKLKTLTVGYTFPDKWIKKAHLSNLRLYLQAQNVFTLTNYTGADPEGLGYPYPQPRTYTFGLSLGF